MADGLTVPVEHQFSQRTSRFMNGRASLPLESLIAVRSRVLQRLEMGIDGDGGEALCDVALDLLQQIVSLLHRPGARNQYVE